MDKNFPLYIWYDILPQEFITLNLLRHSITNIFLSSYANSTKRRWTPQVQEQSSTIKPVKNDRGRPMSWIHGMSASPWNIAGTIFLRSRNWCNSRHQNRQVISIPLQYTMVVNCRRLRVSSQQPHPCIKAYCNSFTVQVFKEAPPQRIVISWNYIQQRVAIKRYSNNNKVEHPQTQHDRNSEGSARRKQTPSDGARSRKQATS